MRKQDCIVPIGRGLTAPPSDDLKRCDESESMPAMKALLAQLKTPCPTGCGSHDVTIMVRLS